MKKIFSLLLAVLIFMCATVFGVNAEANGTVSTVSVYGKSGDIVTLPISYSENSGFYMMFLNVNFDPDVFEYIGFENGSYETASIEVYTYTDDLGKIKFFIENKKFEDITGDGVLLNVKLKIKDNISVNNFAVVLSAEEGMIVNFDTNYVKPSFKNGSVYTVCTEHNFENDICTECGAVLSGDGEIYVDTEKLSEPVLPEIKPEDNNTPTEETAVSDTSAEQTKQNGSKPKIAVMVISVAAIILIAAVAVFVICKRKK